MNDTINAPVPFMVTVYKTLANLEAHLEQGTPLHPDLEGLGLLVSGLSTALLDHGVPIAELDGPIPPSE